MKSLWNEKIGKSIHGRFQKNHKNAFLLSHIEILSVQLLL